MGEARRKLAKREEMLLSCAGVQTVGGRVEVRWAIESAASRGSSWPTLSNFSRSPGCGRAGRRAVR